MAKVASETSRTKFTDPTSWQFAAAEVTKEDKARLRYLFEGRTKCLLFPDDPFVQVWGLCMFLLLIFVAVVTPYRVALESEDTLAWLVIDTVVDSLFFMDLVMNFFLAFYDIGKSLVTSHKRILVTYVKSWLLFDLLACIPIQHLQTSSYNSLVRLSRLPRLYRLIRMFRIMRMLKVIKHRASTMRYMTSFFRISLSWERLFWFCVTLVFLLHLLACTWIFIGKLSIEEDPVNWIAVGGFLDKPNSDLYIISMYWTVTTVSTVGYGDITATNHLERMANSCIMLIGVLIYSYMVGSLTNVIGSVDSRRAKLIKHLESLSELAKEYQLGKAFYSRLTNAVEYEHKNNNQEIDNLVASLPSHLKTQLLVIIHRKKIENNCFFEGRSKHFVAWIVTLLKSVMYDKSEYVYKCNDLASEVYFIIKGSIDFVMVMLGGEASFISMQSGYYFGEIELLFTPNKMRTHTAKVMEKAELLTLREKDFERLMQTFELEGLEILSQAEDRMRRLEKYEKEAVEEWKRKRRVSRKLSIPMPAEARKSKAKQYKKQLQVEIEAASHIDEISECHLSSSSSPSASHSSLESMPSQRGSLKRRKSLLTAPLYERLTTRLTAAQEERPIVQKQVDQLTESVADMRRLLGQLSQKFKLAGVRRPSNNLDVSPMMRRRQSLPRVERSDSSPEVEYVNESTPQP